MLRLLAPSDAAALERFLVAHRDTSMFLRANALRAGLTYEGKSFQATYAAVIEASDVLGVVAHGWTGMLLVQAPDHVEALSRACVRWSGRKVMGLSGPLDQVRRARSTLDLADAPVAMAADEGMYALTLAELRVPSALEAGRLEYRPPLPDEHEALVAWRVAYDIETLGGIDSEETRARAAAFLGMQIADRNAWVVFDGRRMVSFSAFNAALPDIVQLGGVYTPPAFRGRGYAKAAVAASLVEARHRGATRAVLFTNNPSAVRCYEALGFRRIGDYGLVLLRS